MARHIEDGKQTYAYEELKKELNPTLGTKKELPVSFPKGFTKEEWALLPYEQRLDFIQRKKEAVLFALRSRLTSPVVSLVNDLVDLESKMEGIGIVDTESGTNLSPEYVTALKLKIELAKAIKALTDKNVVTHEHIVKSVLDGEAIDVDFTIIGDAPKKKEFKEE